MASPSVGASNTNRSGISACAPSSCTSVLPVGTSTYPLLAPPPTSSRATSAVSVSPGTSSNAGFSPRYAACRCCSPADTLPEILSQAGTLRGAPATTVGRLEGPSTAASRLTAMVFLLGERDEGFFHHRK